MLFFGQSEMTVGSVRFSRVGSTFDARGELRTAYTYTRLSYIVYRIT